MNWQEISGNWVYIPRQPIAVVHFLGGAFVAAAPQITYRLLLEDLAKQGYAIIATPFINTFDHRSIASEVYNSFEDTLELLQSRRYLPDDLPIYGVGHSMGCKLHLTISSMYEVKRAGNILISFNNFSARDAVPLIGQMPQEFNVEFTPNPQETLELIKDYYDVPRNLIIKFKNDTIDQSYTLSQTLNQIFPGMISTQIIDGSHLTPLGQDLQWQLNPQIFTPFDAIGQWIKQEVHRDLHQLKREMLRWLDPVVN
jgi:predicted alpha/beta hydrolase family esterase